MLNNTGVSKKMLDDYPNLFLIVQVNAKSRQF